MKAVCIDVLMIHTISDSFFTLITSLHYVITNIYTFEYISKIYIYLGDTTIG